jgi:peptide deformylase
MTILPITQYGDKILRKKTNTIEEVDAKTIELIKDMFETMKNSNGIGLAANQVGSDKAIFVTDISGVEGYEKSKPLVAINPSIIECSDEISKYEEGCLSVPNIKVEIERPKVILMKYYDTDLKEHSIEADDLLARVLQHEYDHIQGILFVDYFTVSQKRKYRNQLNKIRKREVDIEYPVSENLEYVLR